MIPLRRVGAVVFSRDRALQLDAFLSTVRVHAPELLGELTVVRRATGPAFEATYALLERDWPSARWRTEGDLRADVLAAVGRRPYTVFHTDDDLYFERVRGFHLDDETACFSFRLGLNTTYCYPLDVDEQLREPELHRTWISWRWADHPPGALSYPLALNGHVFRSEDVRRWVEASQFANPNELEERLQGFEHELPPRMASFRRSRLVNVPANLVNDTHPNRHGRFASVAELNDRFLAGERLDPAAMDFSAVTACHQEIPFVYGPR